MAIQFLDSEMARILGVNKALFLKNLEGWISHNAKNNINFRDGYYWSFNTTKALMSIFPYMSERTIKSVIKELKDDGYIDTANYNNSPFNRTLWFTLTDKYYELNKKCTLDSAKIAQSEVQDLHNQKVQNLHNQDIITIDNNYISEKKDISSSSDSDISKEKRDGDSINHYPSKKRFTGINPSLDEIKAYIREKGYHFSAEEIQRYYTSDDSIDVWRFRDGKLVRDWKRCCITFEDHWKERYGSSYQPPKQNDKRIARAEEYERRKRAEQDAAMAAFEAKMKEENELSRIPF